VVIRTELLQRDATILQSDSDPKADKAVRAAADDRGAVGTDGQRRHAAVVAPKDRLLRPSRHVSQVVPLEITQILVLALQQSAHGDHVAFVPETVRQLALRGVKNAPAA